ncbi:cyclic GMP-AMP synthase DncV-like nucleotidyltransferase [Brevibacterium sp. CBA3109]|uniref:Cyclic GMP-AMP synthase DncV-like nucleotidyltransferase n=1 Tax=Brevibacterium koreense TaxID=3140787 RepID=A0AAU7UKG0_9MICO
MKLIAYHDAFLRDTVNLNRSRLDQLGNRVSSIVSALEKDDEVGDILVRHIPQGSWSHNTIIKPLNNHEFDADILVELKEQADWSERDYITAVRDAFKRSTTYKPLVRKKNRCVRIGYNNDCHVDVVPYIKLSDGRQVIVNWAEEKFEGTNPDGFTAWMKEHDELALKNLRKVLRLLKYLRDYKQTFTIPSVILTLLVAERVTSWDADQRYKDVPTALKNMLNDLDQWLDMYPLMPWLEDPSCPGTYFNHRWNEDQYKSFKKRVKKYAAWVNEAYYEPDKTTSLTAWQRVFGNGFKAPAVALSAAASESAPPTPVRLERAPNEQYIEELGFNINLTHVAHIDATALMDGWRKKDLRRLRWLARNCQLDFRVTTDVQEPYDVYWKVRNVGVAEHRLRGEITADDGRRTKRENTLYPGRHYVEAYIVKDGQVRAMDRHGVPIE